MAGALTRSRRTRMIRRSLAALGLAALFAAPAAAQLPLLDVRVGAHAVLPTGDLDDAFDAGFGAYGRIGAPIGPVKLMASVTWNRLKSANPLVEDTDVVTLTAGPHFSLAMLDIGIEGGYFSEFEEFGLAPNVSIGLLKFDLTASYHTTLEDPRGSWMTVGLGFRF
jgi:hypothetical protein